MTSNNNNGKKGNNVYHLYASLACQRMAEELADAERRRLVRKTGPGGVRRSVGKGLVSLGLLVGGESGRAELERAA